MPDVENYRYGETRPNLPTDQTEPFMDDADKRPERYEPPLRDRSGPALSWDRGDNLDDLATDATPLYINEKIHPSAFVEQLRSLEPAPLFGDFNNLPADADYEWYQHEGNWSNRLIRGDSVRVMASLLAKEGMQGKVQMIYMDPPYGIGFKSNLQTATDDRNTPASEKALPADPAVVQTFRDTYANGLNSYLDNLYRNFVYARALLAESGSIFVQIGNENVNRVALVLDEVFGPENRVAQVTFAKTGSTASNTLPEVADYLLWYAKGANGLKYRQLYNQQTRAETVERMSWHSMVELAGGTTRKPETSELTTPESLPTGARFYQRMPLNSQGGAANERTRPYVGPDGRQHVPPPGRQWSVSHEAMDALAQIGRLCDWEDAQLAWKRYESEIPGHRVNNLWAELMRPESARYVVETGERVIEQCIQMTTDPGDLVMDITCGGGTTAYVAEQWGRRWITTDTSGVALAIARQRLLSATYDYYLLQDSTEGALKEAELSGKFVAPPPKVGGKTSERDPASGFVYERVPSVSAAILAEAGPSDSILLINRPIVQADTVRVASPFTVESHSPWRFVAPEQLGAAGEQQLDTRQRIIDAIAVAGIAAGGDRLQIEDIADWGEPALVTHTCVTIDAEGARTRAALAVVPDDQTAGEEFIARAAEEARERRLGRLIVIAFNFDASVHSGAQRRGALEILKAQANRDFQIPGLKDDPADHAFVMLGQPEIALHDEPNGRISVEVLGYDTYNPATGNVERGAKSDVDCWMVDTDYDGKSFYARRIHLPNSSGDKRITRLRNRLGKRVDANLWASMQSMRSAPFPRPKSDHARIAVRIITRTGIEMTIEQDV